MATTMHNIISPQRNLIRHNHVTTQEFLVFIRYPEPTLKVSHSGPQPIEFHVLNHIFRSLIDHTSPTDRAFYTLSYSSHNEFLAKRELNLGSPRFEPTTMQCQINAKPFNQFIFHDDHTII